MMSRTLSLSAALALASALPACDVVELFYSSEPMARGTSPEGTTFLGRSGAQMAQVLAAGDLDGDGLDDVVISELLLTVTPEGDPGDSIVYVLYGTPGGWPAEVDLAAAAVSLTAIDSQISWLFPLGDLDGDGYDDLAVGAPDNGEGYWTGSPNALLVVRGGPTRLGSGDILDRAIAFDEPAGTNIGFAAAAGDLDGSGSPDLVFSRLGNVSIAPALYVFFDPILPADGTSVPAASADLVIPDFQALNLAIGDFDGAGAGELVVARYEDVVVVPGPDPAAPPLWTVTRPPAGWVQLGRQLSTADLDGDGNDDLTISDPAAVEGDGFSRGEVYGFYGGVARSGEIPVADADWIVEGPTDDAFLGGGMAVGTPGTDLAGLVLLGAPGEQIGRGAAYLVDPAVGSSDPLWAIQGEDEPRGFGECSARAGDSVALGDFDGDGATDAMVVSPNLNGSTCNPGRARLYPAAMP